MTTLRREIPFRRFLFRKNFLSAGIKPEKKTDTKTKNGGETTEKKEAVIRYRDHRK